MYVPVLNRVNKDSAYTWRLGKLQRFFWPESCEKSAYHSARGRPKKDSASGFPAGNQVDYNPPNVSLLSDLEV